MVQSNTAQSDLVCDQHSSGDFWIEVTEQRGTQPEFYRMASKPMTSFGQTLGFGETVLQFNLTAYVRHMIAESKQ